MVISPFKKLSPLPLSLTDSLNNVTLRIEKEIKEEKEIILGLQTSPLYHPFQLLLNPLPLFPSVHCDL